MLQPTFFTGHMSGPELGAGLAARSEHAAARRTSDNSSASRAAPARRITIHNIYTTPFVIEAEDLLLRTVCGELKDHPAVWGYSLGNEPDLFCKPPDAGARARAGCATACGRSSRPTRTTSR